MSRSERGVVKWFNNAKGFGFIEHESGKDVFVHYSVIEQDGYKSLKDGEVVTYEITEGPKGFHAAKVKRVDGETEENTLASQLEKETVDLSTASDQNNASAQSENSDSIESQGIKSQGFNGIVSEQTN